MDKNMKLDCEALWVKSENILKQLNQIVRYTVHVKDFKDFGECSDIEQKNIPDIYY